MQIKKNASTIEKNHKRTPERSKGKLVAHANKYWQNKTSNSAPPCFKCITLACRLGESRDPHTRHRCALVI